MSVKLYVHVLVAIIVDIQTEFINNL